MALVSSAVNATLRLLKVIDANQATPARDSQTAIEWLNRMMARWEANGTAVGWSPVSAVDGILPVPEEAELAVIYNLAVVLLSEYPPPDTVDAIRDIAKQSKAELRRDRLTEMPLQLSSDLPSAEGGGRRFNIITDSFG